MTASADGLTFVGFLVATVLIGIASTLDAHARWHDVSERARRFMHADWRHQSSRRQWSGRRR
jgi:hypothetical protein